MKKFDNFPEMREMLRDTIYKLHAKETDYKEAMATSSLTACILKSFHTEVMLSRYMAGSGNGKNQPKKVGTRVVTKITA